ncbi:MAG: ABC transporter ATP-binding protein [Candidatus Methanoperedens sp.]|nr:ABC transporter ATP-binding protein [Candidatus Methanoperedens sp.]
MSSNPVVCLRNISFIRNKKTILDSISLAINSGEHWAVIGPNGSGKTSLISIISGYHWPSQGTAEVLGEKFGSIDLRELRLSIGECSSQIREMIHNWEPVMDIVLSGKFASIGLYEKPSSEDYRRAGELLDFFGLSEIQDKPFSKLSTGEQQKTIIARALMPRPKLLVLDEPCSGLDIGAREELLDTVQEMSQSPGGPTLIYITHHIEEIIPGITHVLALRQGRIMACGLKEDVLTGKVLSEAFDMFIEVHYRDARMWPVVVKFGKA